MNSRDKYEEQQEQSSLQITSKIDDNFRKAFNIPVSINPKDKLFYVPFSKERYKEICNFASIIGSKLQGEEDFNCNYILFNASKQVLGSLNFKSHLFTNKDLRDQTPIVPVTDLVALSLLLSSKSERVLTFGENHLQKFFEKKEKELGYRPSAFNLSKNKGVKLSTSKAPMGKLLKQFPLALEAVAMRSKYGHEKYIETDQDWMNFKRVPNAIEEYGDAIVRHLSEIGEPEETSLDHLKAAAWNILAKLQLILEKEND